MGPRSVLAAPAGARAVGTAAARLLREADNLLVVARSGMVAPMRPSRAARIALAAARWGGSPATGVVIGAIRHPDRLMLVDDRGALTYAEVDRRSSAVAAGLGDAGVGEGDRVGVMCRDHRGFVEATLAATKLGADVLLLNTSFAGPQLTDVCRREGVTALVYDEEFAELVRGAARGRARFLGWAEGERTGEPTLEDLAEAQAPRIGPPGRTGRVTILTSGTTGAPKGAMRTQLPRTLDPVAALLERMPLREAQVARIAAPMFHAWGLSHFVLGMALGATLVLRRRFDAEECLADVAAYGCDVLVVVPVMLQRVLDLPEATRRRYDTSTLRAVCASGSALSGDLAARWMDAFGDTLYNLYGSTEVSAATIATPADLRAAPGTVGRPARGSVVRLLDGDGRPVPEGQSGRIFVGNALLFEGYTGGGTKDSAEGLMATGDVGHFDAEGRLFVEGRDDDMIVSGGENVFPQEVEDALTAHPAVAEAGAVGVDDERFGQRLRAFVVLEPGGTATADELRDHVRSRLARHKVPRDVLFVDVLPRNPTGKVLRRELAAYEPGGPPRNATDKSR